MQHKVLVKLIATDPDSALESCHLLDPSQCGIILGPALFSLGGVNLLARLDALGFNLFLDICLAGEPAEIEATCNMLSRYSVRWLSLSLFVGIPGLIAAQQVNMTNPGKLALIGIPCPKTLEPELPTLGFHDSFGSLIYQQTAMAYEHDLAGVIIPPAHCQRLRTGFPQPFALIAPASQAPVDPQAITQAGMDAVCVSQQQLGDRPTQAITKLLNEWELAQSLA